jgi:tetratricopeptide (TPR) repeat protein
MRSRSAHGRSSAAIRRPFPAYAVAALVVLVLAPSGAHADWRTDFSKAIAAINLKRWSEAEQALERAVAENPNESRNQVCASMGGGIDCREYLPYYHLGVARFGMGDFAGAVEAFEKSLGQQKVQDFQGRFKDLEAKLATARDRIAPQLAEVKRLAETTIAEVTARLSDLRQDAETDPYTKGVLARDRGLATQLDALNPRASGLSAALERARDAAAVQAVDTEAKRIDQDLTVFKRGLDPLVATRRSQWAEVKALEAVVLDKRAAAQSRLDEVGRSDRSLAESLKKIYEGPLEGDTGVPPNASVAVDLADLRRGLEQKGTQLDRLLEDVDAPPVAPLTPQPPIESPTPRSARTPTPLLGSAVAPTRTPPALPTGLPPAPPPGGLPPAPHTLLRDGVRRYFDSAYQEAIDILSTADFGQERFASLQGQLFLAASKFQLYRLGNRRDEALLADARRHLSAVFAVDAGFSPAARYFSPAFLNFFNAERAAGSDRTSANRGG